MLTATLWPEVAATKPAPTSQSVYLPIFQSRAGRRYCRYDRIGRPFGAEVHAQSFWKVPCRSFAVPHEAVKDGDANVDPWRHIDAARRHDRPPTRDTIGSPCVVDPYFFQRVQGWYRALWRRPETHLRLDSLLAPTSMALG